jgi:hypothetical protein
VLRGLRRDHGSLINIGFAFNPLNLLPMLILTVVIATLASVIPPSARHGYGWRKHSSPGPSPPPAARKIACLRSMWGIRADNTRRA